MYGNQISALVGTAGATLDTLGEIATALGNDAALNTTLVNSIATKLPLAGGTLTGATTINAGLSINRGSTSGALWFGTQNDKNHVLWNAYYGTDPVTKGSAGSGFDGIYWNAYRGIHIRGGLNGANNIIVAENTSGSGNNHTVKLYASNVKRFETTTTGAVIENTLLLGNYTDASKQGTLVLGGSTANKQAIIKCTNGGLMSEVMLLNTQQHTTGLPQGLLLGTDIVAHGLLGHKRGLKLTTAQAPVLMLIFWMDCNPPLLQLLIRYQSEMQMVIFLPEK